MALTKEKTTAVVTKFGANEKDTGNTKVQIALLTERILQLTEHSKTFKKDKNCTRGLIMLVGQRRRLMRYLKVTEPENYKKVVTQLEVRK